MSPISNGALSASLFKLGMAGGFKLMTTTQNVESNIGTAIANLEAQLVQAEAKAGVIRAQLALLASITGNKVQTGPTLGNSIAAGRPRGGTMSQEGKERIAAAQRARWAKVRAAKGKKAVKAGK